MIHNISFLYNFCRMYTLNKSYPIPVQISRLKYPKNQINIYYTPRYPLQTHSTNLYTTNNSPCKPLEVRRQSVSAMESERKNAYVHTFLSKQHLSRRESVDLRVTLASRPSFVSPFSPSPRVMVHGLIPITMNLSDVKTQSPPESGLPSSALRPGDHKSRGICDRISYTSWHIPWRATWML